MDAQACTEQSQERREARIQELEREIADLKARCPELVEGRWPKHSVSPAMLMRLVLSRACPEPRRRVEGLEELEEELVLSRVEGLDRLRERDGLL